MKRDQNSYPLLMAVYIYTVTLEVWIVVSTKVEHLQYLLFFKDMTFKMLIINFLLNSSRYHYGIVKENLNKKWCTQVLITFCPLSAGWTGASLSLSFCKSESQFLLPRINTLPASRQKDTFCDCLGPFQLLDLRSISVGTWEALE